MRRALLCLGVLCAGCATSSSDSRTAAPPSSAQAGMGYQDAVALGCDTMTRLGHPDAKLRSAAPIGRNIWCVRFGLSPGESGPGVELHFDGKTRALLEKAEGDVLTEKLAHPAGD